MSTDRWELVEDLLDEEERERASTMTREQRREEMKRAGVEPQRVRSLVERALAEAAAEDGSAGARDVAAVVPPAPPAKVMSLDQARSRRRSTLLIALIAAALGAALLGGGLSMVASNEHPAPSDTSTLAPPPTAPPPSPEEIAADLRQQALDDCAKQYWSECADKLDRARALDPSGELTREVQLARSAIYTGNFLLEAGVDARFFDSKPVPGPTEHPLPRRKPR